MSDILPCPFCGVVPTITEHRYSDDTGERVGYVAIECLKHSTGPPPHRGSEDE